MVNLHRTENPLSRPERVKINENWDMIKARFSNLQYQINFLSGKEVDVIVNRINDAIANAESVTTDAEEKLIEISDALAQLSTVITNAVNATTRADGAADDANVLNVALTQLKGELEQLQVDLTGIVQAESQRVINEGERVANEDERKDNENNRALAEQSRVKAETNRETAEGLRNDAEVIRQQKLAELLAILNELDFKGEYDPTVSYKAFNVVRFGRASYVALQDVSGVTPSDDGINWRILAAGGIDGSGAVSTVNNIQPDGNGNINLIIDYINNVTSDRIDAGLSAAMGTFLMSLITALQNDKVDAAFVDAEVNRLIAAAPGMLDTFEEIANALNNDPNFANTIITLLNEKASNVALGQTNDSLAQTNNNLSTLQQRVTTHLDKKAYCIAKKTLSFNILSNDVTKVTYDDLNNALNITKTTDGEGLIIHQDGFYQINVTANFSANGDNSRTVLLRVNDQNLKEVRTPAVTAIAGDTIVGLACGCILQKDDIISVILAQNSGAILSSSENSIEIVKVSDL